MPDTLSRPASLGGPNGSGGHRRDGRDGEEGRKRARNFTKGRQVSPAALAQIRGILGDAPRRRDLLIEYLHNLQDRFGHLSADHLAALAQDMRLPMAEVYEVATFYAHFDVVKEGERPPAATTIRVCESLSCQLAGAEALHRALAENADADVRVVKAPCMGACDQAPAVAVGHHQVFQATAESVLADVARKVSGESHPLPAYQDLDGYRAEGGYTVLQEVLSGERTSDGVLDDIDLAGLRGLGGAGFPTGRKWRIVRDQHGEKIMAINADEGEVGTFKDRRFLEDTPHKMLEGILIGAHVVGAKDAYIYLRDEYPEAHTILTRELAKLSGTGLADHCAIHLRRGAGAYICGEESAMIESLEGKRGLPRHRPPYVAQIGLFGRPTLVNNVETLSWIPTILAKGGHWFADQGRRGKKGLRSFSVSGRVKNPGVKLTPAGITVRELIDEFCGGMADGHSFKGYLPGGASGGILPAHMDDLILDFGELEHLGSFVGSHAVVILSDQDSIRDAALNLMRFFEDESCGQCTPCRVGTEKAVKLMRERDWDTELLQELAQVMRDASICGLGQAAPNPLLSCIKWFPEEFEK
ncbi:MAG: NAD(P)H-dependent oxidoreductase subunit E [Alphaproteobacteria bacterium]|nr:NAD(P)H-dependent oxidoreductase subunit E [Alphaproteobacteria bacterium]